MTQAPSQAQDELPFAPPAEDLAAQLAWARTVLCAAAARLGEERLAAKVGVEFNARFTRRLGDARFDPPRIRLSAPLWPRTSEDERRSTIVHELCHLVARRRHGRRVEPHGAEWRAIMREAGVSPDVTHRVDRAGLARQQRRYVFRCDCADIEHRVSASRLGRMRRGCTYLCRTCGAKLR